MENKKQKLIDTLGFSDKKARVYLALLEAGETTVGEIAKRSGLKRTTVYNIIPELKQEGFIKSTIYHKKHYFYVENIKNLERIAEEKVKMLKELVPLLKLDHNVLSNRPKITLYEGVTGMNQLYQNIIDEVIPGETIFTYIGSKDFDTFISPEVLKKYVDQRLKKKIINHVIAGPDLSMKNREKESKSQQREMKFTKNGLTLFSGDMKIFGNKVAFLSYKENFFGVTMESTEISSLLRNLFQIAWETL